MNGLPGAVQGGSREKGERLVDALVLGVIVIYLIGVFDPRYVLLKTIATGGDTASHFYTAKYLKETLLPQGRISGWTQGNYAGFPILQFYFPLPFLLMVGLSCILPLEIAFKLVTVLGSFMLPLCAYVMFRLMRCGFPIPVLGAVATLPFLFNEANSMWGGNIPSTLAGEFAYSMSLAFALILLGNLYRGMTIEKGGRAISNVLLVFMVGFTHAYPLLFCGVASLFFLVTLRGIVWRVVYLLRMYVLAFLLLGFWIVPLLWFSSFTVAYNSVWNIYSFFEVIPRIMLPGAILGAAGSLYLAVRRFVLGRGLGHEIEGPVGFLWFSVVASVFLYLLGQNLGVVDIRFVPFGQLSLALLAAPGLGVVTRSMRGRGLLALAMVVACVLWIDLHMKNIPGWVKWNYEGFERKPAWGEFQAITHELKGTINDPRVVFEHSPDHDRFGSTRAFESLPLFSGRATLEGLYMQASISAPFVFYIQSELSRVSSCPFAQYSYAHLDVASALEDLKLFNVGEYLAKSKEAREAARKNEGFRRKAVVGDYEIYEVEENQGRYVVPLEFKPVLCDTPNWKRMSFAWFVDRRSRDVHMAFAPASEYRAERFSRLVTHMNEAPREKIDIRGCVIEEHIDNDTIRIRTNWIGKPLLVKISYHPNWHVDGADRIYLVSPSFMLIYPERTEVTLSYGRSFPDWCGVVLTLVGAMCLWAFGSQSRVVCEEQVSIGTAQWTTNKRRSMGLVLIVCLSLAMAGAYAVKRHSPLKLFNRAVALKDTQRYEEARRLFRLVSDRVPSGSLGIDSLYYIAITYYREKRYAEAIEAFENVLVHYPGSTWVPEAEYHIGVCLMSQGHAQEARAAFEKVDREYPGTLWQRYARERLAEMPPAAGLLAGSLPESYNRAILLFNEDRCEEAKPILRELFEKHQEFEGAPQALACYALCLYKAGQWAETIRYYGLLLQRYPTDRLAEEARVHIERCKAILEETVR